MKMRYLLTVRILIMLVLTIPFTGCESILEEEVFVDISANEFWQSDADAITAVNAIYAKMRADGSVTGGGGQQEGWGGFGYGESTIFNYSQVQTDEMLVRWSGFNAFLNFTLTPSSYGNFGGLFSDLFEGIYIANNVLINIEGKPNISKEIQDRVKGEALFGRALYYSQALSLFGNIPKITVPDPDPFNFPEQVAPDEIAQLIREDLSAAAALLPESYPPSDYGRFTKGAAFALLARVELNQKNWDAAIGAAREVLTLNYQLSTDYASIFVIENQGNSEILLSIPCLAQPGIGNTMIAHTAEPDYVTGSWGGHLIRNEFYDTFDPADNRRKHLIKNYTSVTGAAKTVTDGAIIAKYQPDPNRVGAYAGNDIVLHRLSEVYLTLAEALNEANGPNQESIDLINELRDRAFDNNISKRINLGDFATKESLRDHILAERGWELFAENYRREDLIRHGKYVSRAIERGVTAAKSFHVLYPIPQTEIDRNTKLKQNKGY
jgi:hypothetical protein